MFTKTTAILSALCCTLFSIDSIACTRVVYDVPGNGTLVGRNMDWFESMDTNLWILPRGMAREGLAGENSLKWTSKYGSLATVVYNGATADGLNEKGLNAAILYLSESQYGKRDLKEKGMSLSLWAQYFLDNYATVAEAIEDFNKHPFQPVMATAGDATKVEATVHLAITDKSGDTAVIEYIAGKPTIYHGKQYTVMTNSPAYNLQLENLKQYSGLGGNKPLPGTTEAADRFVRAAFYLAQLPQPKNYRESVAELLSVMRNVAEPFGTKDPARPNIAPTLWRTVADLNDGLYFYESVLSPNTIWVNLNEISFDKDKTPMMLDLVNHKDYVGNVTKLFKDAKMFNFIPATLTK